MESAQRARIAAKAAANAEYVDMMAGLRRQPGTSSYNVVSEMDAISTPAADIRHGPANHGADVAQIQADALAAQYAQQVKQEFDLAGWINKNAEKSQKAATAEKEARRRYMESDDYDTFADMPPTGGFGGALNSSSSSDPREESYMDSGEMGGFYGGYFD